MRVLERPKVECYVCAAPFTSGWAGRMHLARLSPGGKKHVFCTDCCPTCAGQVEPPGGDEFALAGFS